MPITVGDLLELPKLGLSVVAGVAGLDRAIRWAHTSELSDPTPWLSGGELVLTTGMGVRGSPALQRAYVRRLVESGVAGLGFGVGFGFDEVPPTVLRAADKQNFPVLEVPYPVPFIAIAEAVATHLTEDRLRDAQLSVEVHERLASLVSGGAGPADVLDEVVGLAAGWALLFDLSGRVLARAESHGSRAPDPAASWASLPPALVARRSATSSSSMGPGGTQVAFAVTAGKHSEGILMFGKEGRLDGRDRIVVHHAVTVLGLLLASRRAVIDAERRVTGDILSEAFAGRITGGDLERRLELMGFPPGIPLTALVFEPSPAAPQSPPDELAWAVDAALGTRARTARTSLIGGRVAALVIHSDPDALAGQLLAELDAAGESPGVRAGVGETVAAREVRRSYLAAVIALRAASRDRRVGEGRVGTPKDLGSYSLLLGGQPRPVLEGFVRSVLGPLIERDRARNGALVDSVRAYVEAGGKWEAGAGTLGVHRHTLRYRVRRAEELLGRDLGDPQDRMEVWLALRAAEILEH